jgi:RNA polymerase sigma factor (sigma-70 family)
VASGFRHDAGTATAGPELAAASSGEAEAAAPDAPTPDAAWRVVIERYGRLIRSTLARVAPPGLRLDLDDLEQETHLRLWRALKSETEIRDLASYIYRVTATTVLDAMRRSRSRPEVPVPAEELGAASAAWPAADESPEKVAVERGEVERVAAAFSRLSPERKRAVGLYLRGFTTAEIAELLSWREPKARSLVYRGLQQMRAELAPPGGSR